MEYFSIAEEEYEEVFRTLRINKFEEILTSIPKDKILSEPLNIPEGKGEMEVRKIVEALAMLNKSDLISFLGAGIYDHFIPSLVSYITSKPEFYTPYTPYQPEVSQGTLQAMFEFQSLICNLTEMDISNSSMYDGASALAEAILMAHRITGKDKVLLPLNIHPYYQKVAKTYTSHIVQLKEIPFDKRTGRISIEDIEKNIDASTSAILVQHPNFFGILEEMEVIQKIKEEKEILLIVVFDPLSLGILKTPGNYNADIAVSEGQSLGLAQGFGGPLLGIFTSKKEYLRMMPGRIAGMTVDKDCKRAFTMVFQTREQHIRREKATSNICTNQMLCALSAAVYLSVLGKKGIREISEIIVQKSHKLKKKLEKIEGIDFPFSAPFFKEFVIKLPFEAHKLVKKMIEYKILAGVPLDIFGYDQNFLMVAVTEKREDEELELYTDKINEIIRSFGA